MLKRFAIAIVAILGVLASVATVAQWGWVGHKLGSLPTWGRVLVVLALLVPAVWWARRAASPAPHPDRDLFATFLDVLPSTRAIAFLKRYAGQPITPEVLRELGDFVDTWTNAEHEFHDRSLEKARKKLVVAIKEYLGYMALNTFTTPRGDQSVPGEWEWEQPDRMRTVIDTLQTLGNKAVAAHQELVRLGRKQTGLRVVMREFTAIGVMSVPSVTPSLNPLDYADDIIEDIRWHWRPITSHTRIDGLVARCPRCAGNMQSLNVPPRAKDALPIELPDEGRGYRCLNAECGAQFDINRKYKSNAELQEAVASVIPARLRSGSYREAPARLQAALRT